VNVGWHGRAQVAVNHPPQAVQVQLLPDGLNRVRSTKCEAALLLIRAAFVLRTSYLVLDASARSSIGSGRRPLKPQRRVRFPHGLFCEPTWPSGETGRHATLRPSCREAWEFDSPLGHFISTQVSQCSTGPHKPGPSGATPEPAIHGRVRKLAKRRVREPATEHD
jgi:hypothetical protein